MVSLSWELRWKYPLTANQGHYGVSHGLEEEKAVQHIDFDLHDDAGGDDIEKDNDIEGTDGIQNHIPWTSQGFFEFRHHNSPSSNTAKEKKVCQVKDV